MIYYETELYHHGILGMKWGVRRFQRKDGTRTPLGKKRERQEYHDDYKKVHDRKSVKYMSDQELQARNKRLNAERQYKQLTGFNPQKYTKAFIAGAGTLTGLVAAYGTYKKFAEPLVMKAANKLVNVNVLGSLH